MRLLSYLILLMLMFGCAAKQPNQPAAFAGANASPLPSPSVIPENTSSSNTSRGQIPENAKLILDNAETLEVLFLQARTSYHPAAKYKLNSADKYFGMEILGRVLVHDAKAKRELLDSLYAGIASISFGESYMCVAPRHGLRATYRGKTTALVISFSCQNFYLYTFDDQTHPSLNAISKNAEGMFDRILKEANISTE